MNTEKMTQRIECKPTEDGTVAIAFIETNNTGRFVKLPAGSGQALHRILIIR